MQRFAFSPDAAAYTYTGMTPAELPLPSMDWFTSIYRVLRQVHPDTAMNVPALLVMEDLVTVRASPCAAPPRPVPLRPIPHPVPSCAPAVRRWDEVVAVSGMGFSCVCIIMWGSGGASNGLQNPMIR